MVLAGGSAERNVCADIASCADGIHDMSGATSLGEFFALVEAADLLIVNDSGAAHVAGSLATPAVVIFGSTSPLWTAPLGEQTAVVRHPTLCSPCYLKTCPTNLECFAGIRPSHIVERALGLVKKEFDIHPGGGKISRCCDSSASEKVDSMSSDALQERKNMKERNGEAG